MREITDHRQVQVTGSLFGGKLVFTGSFAHLQCLTVQLTAQSDLGEGGGVQGMKLPDCPHFSQVDQSNKQQHDDSSPRYQMNSVIRPHMHITEFSRAAGRFSRPTSCCCRLHCARLRGMNATSELLEIVNI